MTCRTKAPIRGSTTVGGDALFSTASRLVLPLEKDGKLRGWVAAQTVRSGAGHPAIAEPCRASVLELVCHARASGHPAAIISKLNAGDV